MRIVLALLGFVATIVIVGALVQLATASLPMTVSLVIGASAASVSVFGLVYLLRRRLDRKPQDLVRFDRTTTPLLLSGIAIAAAVALLGGAVNVWLGNARWGVDWGGVSIPVAVISIAASTLLAQGFPEELVFRGYIFANLRERMPLWATVVVSSLIFGSIHVFSHGGANTLTERLVYALMAAGFGLMLACCRVVSGSLWLGVGFHAGHDAFVRMFVTLRPDAFIGAQLVTFGALVLAAYLTGSGSRGRSFRRQPSPRP
ncbi:CPBP family intramembrane glutamic endopeptidase [Lentzea sp. NPDC006480]|uniref:CPBP family intramembrane glutamic endopeptidase n=1 Tax=Lentzea sp. NPDC006480 TaxID=3157176 RepID=UPI0033B59693